MCWPEAIWTAVKQVCTQSLTAALRVVAQLERISLELIGIDGIKKALDTIVKVYLICFLRPRNLGVALPLGGRDEIFDQSLQVVKQW